MHLETGRDLHHLLELLACALGLRVVGRAAGVLDELTTLLRVVVKLLGGVALLLRAGGPYSSSLCGTCTRCR